MMSLARQPEALVFPCQGSTLVGVLHLTRSEPAEVAVVVLVGGPQYRVGSHRQFVSSARALAAAGYPVLRFDYRGMGDSEGEYAGFERVGEDVRAAVDIVMARCTPRRGVVLLGLCDAASTALMYCGGDDRIAGLILMNPWVRTAQGHAQVVVKRYYAARVLQADFWKKLASGKFDLVGSLLSFLRNLARASKWPGKARKSGFIAAMRTGIEQFEKPLLLVQSGRDLTADEFRALCEGDATWQRALARNSVEVVNIIGADHTFSRLADLEEFHRHCSGWFERHFGDGSCR